MDSDKSSKIKQCPICGKDNDSYAIFCKHCKSLQKDNNAKKNIKILLALVFVLAIMFIAVPNSDDNKKMNVQEEAIIENKVPETTEVMQRKLVAYTELKSYEKSGYTWRNITVPLETSNEDLIALAKDLHVKDPVSYFHIFDDASKFQEYMNWDINYGKIRDKDGKIKNIDQCLDILYCRTLVQQGKEAFPFPESWATKHELAIINEMMDTGGLKWKLSDPFGIEISNL